MVNDSNVIMEMSGTKEISINLDLCKKKQFGIFIV